MLCSLSHAATWPEAGWKDISLPHKMWCSVECFCLRRDLRCCLFFFFFLQEIHSRSAAAANQEQMLSCGCSCNEWLPVFSCCPESWCPLRGEDAARTPHPTQLAPHSAQNQPHQVYTHVFKMYLFQQAQEHPQCLWFYTFSRVSRRLTDAQVSGYLCGATWRARIQGLHLPSESLSAMEKLVEKLG